MVPMAYGLEKWGLCPFFILSHKNVGLMNQAPTEYGQKKWGLAPFLWPHFCVPFLF